MTLRFDNSGSLLLAALQTLTLGKVLQDPSPLRTSSSFTPTLHHYLCCEKYLTPLSVRATLHPNNFQLDSSLGTFATFVMGSEECSG